VVVRYPDVLYPVRRTTPTKEAEHGHRPDQLLLPEHHPRRTRAPLHRRARRQVPWCRRPDWKIWLDSPDEPRVGGIYLFESRAAADAYLAGPIVAGLRNNSEVFNLECRVFDVRERMSEITRAPIGHRAAAAE
jgi:hypothetical protein